MARRQWALDKMRSIAASRGFREIQMPTFEDLELFTKKSGPGIVDELYAFKDKGDRDLALRPEMTAQVMRFYVSDLSTLPKPIKLFYFGPCFRYENPQAGRYREFFQFGAEIIGSATPETDAEAIALAGSIMECLGLKGYIVRVGFIGILRSMLKELKFSDSEISAALHYLDKNDLENFTKCTIRNSVPKQTIEKLLAIRNLKGGIEILDKLDAGDARDYLRDIIDSLSPLDVKNCQIDLGIIRGLDYYTGMVFEIDAPKLGAEKQICGGGSYDLVPLFGGEQVFTTGFAIGFDRVIIALEKEGMKPVEQTLDVYVIPMGGGARKTALEIVEVLRKCDVSVDFDMMRRSLSKNLKYAASVNAKKAIIVGEKELAKAAVTVRDMVTGEQKEVPIRSLAEAVQAKD